jgi:phospholipid/cholesterol/gamma-HCH transport system substrate-binding protein
MKESVDNAVIITSQLAEITNRINNGHGVISKILSDSSFALNISKPRAT